jgi:hypothetical protein
VPGGGHLLLGLDGGRPAIEADRFGGGSVARAAAMG